MCSKADRKNSICDSIMLICALRQVKAKNFICEYIMNDICSKAVKKLYM